MSLEDLGKDSDNGTGDSGHSEEQREHELVLLEKDLTGTRTGVT